MAKVKVFLSFEFDKDKINLTHSVKNCIIIMEYLKN